MAKVRNALRKADEWLENLSIGLGHGFANQAEGTYQMARHPVQFANALYQMGKGAVADPRAAAAGVGNALRDTAQRATSGPLGFGEVVGENVSPGMFRGRVPRRNELITYHSSPHRINNVTPDAPYGRFDMSKIGTGEGAQAYGHGIYLSEDGVMNRNHYFNKFNQSNSWRVGDEVFTPNPHAMEYTWKNRVAMALREADGDIDKAIAAIKKTVPEGYQGGPAIEGAMGYLHRMKRLGKTPEKATASFYTVDLPDEHIAKMLDWDAPLSQQPEAVRKALDQAKIPDEWQSRMLNPWIGTIGERWARRGGNPTGKEIYAVLSESVGQDAASDILNKNGIPGIKYFDGGSRAAGEGTRNFVIFDGDYAKILKRE